jgi:pimeloyl-ACP methyl ester carboxylesterase
MKLLLLPGLDGTGLLFDPFVKALPANLSPIIVRYPLDLPLGYEQLLDQVRIVAESLTDFVVLGESFSGPLAIRLAAEMQPNLRGIILVASFADSPIHRLLRPLTSLVPRCLLRSAPVSWSRRLLLGPHFDRRVETLRGEALRSVTAAVLQTRIRAVATVDATNALRQITQPLLYFSASKDRVVPSRCWRHIRSILPAAQLATFDSPHLILQSCPAEAAVEVERFVDSLR